MWTERRFVGCPASTDRALSPCKRKVLQVTWKLWIQVNFIFGKIKQCEFLCFNDRNRAGRGLLLSNAMECRWTNRHLRVTRPHSVTGKVRMFQGHRNILTLVPSSQNWALFLSILRMEATYYFTTSATAYWTTQYQTQKTWTLIILVVPLCTIKFNIHQFYVLPTQCIYMCFVLIPERTATYSLHIINWLIFTTQTACVQCAVPSGILNVIQVLNL